jgi:outer membrane autotransporter protein
MTPSLWPGGWRRLRQSCKPELVTKSGESPGIDKLPTLNAGAVAVDSINVAAHLGLVVGLYLGVASPLLAQITQDAYVPNHADNTVSVIDTATQAVTDTIPVGTVPYGAAVTPDGLHAYVSNHGNNTVSEIDTVTNAIVTIAVGSMPAGIAVTPDGLHAYVANFADGTVSVIDTATQAVVNTIAAGTNPLGVAVTPDGLHAYVANNGNSTVSVIDTATHAVVNTIAVGTAPFGVAVTPDGLHAYVANEGNNTVSVIDTATHAVVNTIAVGTAPLGVAVTPDGLHVFVANQQSNTVSEIDTATHAVVNTIAVGSDPFGLAVTPDGLHVYVTNETGNTVSVIDTVAHTIANTIPVGSFPLALGNFVGPNLITGTLSVTNEAELTTLGFGQFVDFQGGTLQTAAGLNDTHTLSLLTAGTIDTNGFNSAFSGNIIGVGTLIKAGAGTLTLSGTNTYMGGTTVSGGVLSVSSDTNLGAASGGITLAGGELLTTTDGFSTARAIDVRPNGGLNTLAAATGTTATYSGVLSDTGALVVGDSSNAGTVVLTGNNSYSGGTTIVGGILQIGNGGTTGSIGGNVVDNGSLVFNRSDAITFSGIVSGTGSLSQTGSGSLTLTTANTYSGGTVIDRGTLLVDNAQALGVGNVTVNGGVLAADPQPINVKGNYTQNAGGTLQLNVAGGNPGQYDTLNVGGSAALGGTLKLISLGFQPKAGDALTLITTGGAVSGRFAQFVDPFASGPGFKTVDLVYGRNSVLLEFLNVAQPIPPVVVTTDFSSFAFTPNQKAAGNLLDAVQLDPRAANLISFLSAQPFTNLPNDLQKISPDGLTAFYEIGFSIANIQKLNLESRFDDIHNGSNGFSSNMKVNGATVNLEDRGDADGKSSKAVVEPILQPGPQNRWGVWVIGFGDFVNVDGDGNAQGYNFTTGGVSVGLDYRITDQLAIGVMGEYSHTWTELNPSGHIDVDSGRGGVYATWFSHGIYINGAIYGGHNNYDSGRAGLGGLANGSTEGSEWSTFIGGGYDFHFPQLKVGPIASLQFTDVGVDSFEEKGSLAPLNIHSGSAESLRSDVGFRAFYQWQIGKIVVEPSLKAAWEHEYKYSALPVTAGFAGIPGPSATFFGPSEGHDSAVVSAGVSVQVTPAITTYVTYDGQLGRGNYDSNAVTGGIKISF